MPSPNKGEKRNDFMYRCMSSRESIETFNDSKQRSAFCYSQWGKKVKGQPTAKIGRLGPHVHTAKKEPPVKHKRKRRR